WGVFVSTPKVSGGNAVVRIQTTVVNDSRGARAVTLRTTIHGPDGRAAPLVATDRRAVPAGRAAVFDQQLSLRDPRLWDIDHPSLYRAVSEVVAGGRTLDEETTAFGIR